MSNEYLFLARQPSGQVTRGTQSAASAAALRSELQARGWQLLSFRESTTHHSLSATTGFSAAWQQALVEHSLVERALIALPPRWRHQELALRQLSMLLRSGLDLLSALKSVAVQTTSLSMKRVIAQLSDKIASGHALGHAMEDTKVFPTVAVQLVNVGEQTGHLAEVLEQAASHMSERRTIITEVRVALAYPIIVASAAIAIAIYLIFGVIPELQKFLSAMGRKLPAMTQSLVDIAMWFQLYGASFVVMTTSIVIAGVLVVWIPRARLVVDRWLLRMPIIGHVLRLAGTAMLASSLSIMMRSGVHLIPALAVAERLQKNRYLASRLGEARQSVLSGNGLASTLARCEGYLPILGSMVQVAEQTGTLPGVLNDVSQFCQSELRARIKRLSMMVEPAIIILAGSIVGYVYIAFFMALMSAGGNIR